MKRKPPQHEKQLGHDLKTIEQLPPKIKELVVLEAEAEKVTGQESADIHRKIRVKSQAVTDQTGSGSA